jgi:hypothetical protein
MHAHLASAVTGDLKLDCEVKTTQVVAQWFAVSGESKENLDTVFLTSPLLAGNQGESLMTEIVRAHAVAALCRSAQLPIQKAVILDLLAPLALWLDLSEWRGDRVDFLLQYLVSSRHPRKRKLRS